MRSKLLVVSCELLVGFVLWDGVCGVAVGQMLAGQQEVAKPQRAQPQEVVPPFDPNAPQEPSVPKGTVLFERKDDLSGEAESQEKKSPDAKVPDAKSPEAKSPDAKAVDAANVTDAVTISDAERSALTFTAYDLDAHLVPAHSQLVMHARFSVRNDGASALTKIAVQVSSSLQWDSFALANGAKAGFVQHLIDTDADHTGQAREAVVTLAEPLQPGGVVELSAFYSGQLAMSAGRLERIGAPAVQALAADWDGVMPGGTALRGFGNVLWYPTAGVPVFLGEGATLFKAVGKTKLRQSAATIRLRLTVEYVGDAPKTAYFCGVREPMRALSENENALTAEAPGVASAEFPVRALGFRVPSLFVTDDTAKMVDAPALRGAIEVVTEHGMAPALYGSAAGQVQPLLQEWLGDAPLRALTVLDYAGQPFEDGAFLVTPMGGTDPAEIATVLAHSLTHAWFGSSHVWLNEGVAQFMSYLWMERTQGRDYAMQQIDAQAKVLAFAEPAAGAKPAEGDVGQSLIQSSDEVYYRTKAAAVLWMLRSIAGDVALKDALRVYRRDAKKDEDPHEFQRVLEKTSHKDLGWFFEDWVYRDKGLPDLSIVNVTPRELTVKDGRGGWLVAVEVHNSGDAAVEVPVTVRAGGLSGSLTTTERIRVLGGASSSTRILFEGTPEEVVVNDGSVPEVGGSLHVTQLRVGKQ